MSDIYVLYQISCLPAFLGVNLHKHINNYFM